MTEQQRLEARLANTERALLSLATLLLPLQPAETHHSLDEVMEEYFNANISLGFDGVPGFTGDEQSTE